MDGSFLAAFFGHHFHFRGMKKKKRKKPEADKICLNFWKASRENHPLFLPSSSPSSVIFFFFGKVFLDGSYSSVSYLSLYVHRPMIVIFIAY
jgi:hypothetical protein